MHGVGALAPLLQGRGQASGARLVAIRDHDDRAGLGQNRRDARTDTAARRR